jgi:hypothetical protein
MNQAPALLTEVNDRTARKIRIMTAHGFHDMAGTYRPLADCTSDCELHTAANTCHCGMPMRGSDHCPGCGCEQYEAVCEARTVLVTARNRRPAEAEVEAYLPVGYQVAGETEDGLLVCGTDTTTRTMESYVIPRLGRGGITARVLPGKGARPATRVNLDPSLAFTALLEMWPGFTQMSMLDTHPLTAGLAKAMSESDPPDRWKFARRWIDAHVKADATPRYKITWTYRGGGEMESTARYTWAQVEHSLGYDDGDRTTAWETDPSVRSCTCSVPPDGNPDHASVTDKRCPVHGLGNRCPGERGRHDWICATPVQGPDARYGCQHCPATAWGREIGLEPAAAAPSGHGSGCRHCGE